MNKSTHDQSINQKRSPICYQDWEEFQTLAKHASVFNTVVDFIPLEEILEITHEIVEKKDPTAMLETRLESQLNRTSGKEPDKATSLKRSRVRLIDCLVGLFIVL